MPALTLSFDKPTYSAEDPIRLTVTLRNNETDAILVNKRLALNSPFASGKFREVKLDISDGAGAALPFSAKLNLGFVQDSDFASLAPGEGVQRSFELRGYYAFKQPGRYTVTAVYQNGADSSDEAAWKGEVASDAVGVVVS